MTDLINAIMNAMQDKQPTEGQVNAILSQVCHLLLYREVCAYSFTSVQG